MEVPRLMAPCLLNQRCLSKHLFSAKDANSIVSGRSSDSRSPYFLHLPNETSVAFADFVTLTAAGPRLNFTAFPFTFSKENQKFF